MATYRANCVYGDYVQKDVTVRVDRRLKYMPYAQAGYRIYMDESYIVLVSYETDVIAIDLTRKIMQCTGLYSRTTRKHIGAFLREMAELYGFPVEHCNYHTAEAVAHTRKAVSLLNGNTVGGWL